MKKLITLATLTCVVFFIPLVSAEEEAMETNFSITGDFTNAMATDFEGAKVTVTAAGLSEDGEPIRVELGVVELVESKFTLDGHVEHATVADISLKLVDVRYPVSGQAIVEPGGELKVEFFGPRHSLLVLGDGLHAELISSWQSDPEYLDASIAYGFYMESLYSRMDKQRAAQEAKAAAMAQEETGADESVAAVAEETEEPEFVPDDREPTEHAEVLDWASMECADYTVENYVGVLDRENDYEYPLLAQATMRMSEVMSAKRSAVLETVVTESDDPTKRLFAMELGAFGGMDKQSKALSAWRLLATELDEQTVASRVQPTIDRLEERLRIQENDAYYVPGVFAPQFTLPNFEGTDVTLASLLEENEVVMVDFWASWCGPCIAQFPHLKHLYAMYADKGFEIVGISLDSSFEDWEGAVEEHQPPWVNLGEINEDGWGPVSQEYGTQFIPHTYVLDDESCIMKKDLQPHELEDFLEARLDS